MTVDGSDVGVVNFNLSDAAIVNQSRNAEMVGDVSLFRSIDHLAAWAEPGDVRNREYFAYTCPDKDLILTSRLIG
ncbi:hypothetical protein LQG66_23975 [Bradyrhizobium ontarionense]|uniref:Uncharacterized protein n=1 Tax=Bradyrhizobium ontarionense TaxID=2898149 RepID=A0ABY3R4V4_9BRAD|nr:hypothetical protein [Bradyrhizobium sp. A19]UFZ02341.1 hypothetical protein LQG66_23975 [Bradyrhizobium sp. A19]